MYVRLPLVGYFNVAYHAEKQPLRMLQRYDDGTIEAWLGRWKIDYSPPNWRPKRENQQDGAVVEGRPGGG